MPCDVVEERERERGLEKRRGDLGREREEKDGTLWEEKCHFMQQFAVAGLSGCGRVCLQCD